MKKIFLSLVLTTAVLMSACINSNNSSSSSSETDSKVTNSSNVADTKPSTPSNVKDNKDTSNSINEKYTIEKVTYKNNNIQINYPQIRNLGNSAKENKINEIIKKEALSSLNEYQGNIADLSFDLDFEIKYKGTDFLSIAYLGTTYVKGGMHPDHVIQTSNIDLVKEKSLVLPEVAHTADEKLASKILAGKYKSYKGIDLEAEGALKQVLEGHNSHSLMLDLNTNTAKFYFTKDSLGVSMYTQHASGDHFEMEVEYKSLGDLLSIKPK